MAITALLVPHIAGAQTQSFEASQTVNGHTFHARVDFTLNTATNTFSVVLTNLGGPAAVNGHVLTAVFWDDGFGGDYGRQSAGVTAGSTVRVDPSGAIYSGNQSVGQHWAYNNLTFQGYDQGISAIGTGLFGGGDAFQSGGNNPVLNGVDWGLVNGTVAGGVSGSQSPFIHNSATFVLSGLRTTTAFNRIRFQYGSDVSSGFSLDVPPKVPEGSSLAMLAGGGLPLFGFLRKRRRKS
jgi:hypothetical protein